MLQWILNIGQNTVDNISKYQTYWDSLFVHHHSTLSKQLIEFYMIAVTAYPILLSTADSSIPQSVLLRLWWLCERIYKTQSLKLWRGANYSMKVFLFNASKTSHMRSMSVMGKGGKTTCNCLVRLQKNPQRLEYLLRGVSARWVGNIYIN